MIIEEKLEKPYEEYTIRSSVWYRCDYCGCELLRNKKSRERCNITVNKDSCQNKECKKLKAEDVCMVKYGVKNFLVTNQFNEKKKQTCIEKFGTEEYFASNEFLSKKKDFMLAKYGVESPLQSKEIRTKHEKTMLEKYGPNPKFDRTYGPEVLEKGIEKRKQTCVEKFGTEHYTQTQEYKDGIKQLFQDRCGVDHPLKVPEIRDKVKNTIVKRYGFESYSKTEEFKERYMDTCIKKYGVPCTLCLNKNRKFGKLQKSIKKWLDSLECNFEENNYSILQDKEIDLYDEQLKIAIEFCGIYWHSEKFKDREYHYKKYQRCKLKKIRLLTIFEDEWISRTDQCKNFIKSILKKNTFKLCAKECEIIQLTKADVDKFCDKHHIEGKSNLGVFFVGLKYDNELLSVMSLGTNNIKSNTIILDRFCFVDNVYIVGGTEKMFHQCKHWANKHYKTITAISDNRWTYGNVYEKLGFEYEMDLPIGFTYISLGGKPVRSKSQMKKWSRIWDCGRTKWIYKL